jgi:ABC-type lipoprotein release transport system permease subunit
MPPDPAGARLSAFSWLSLICGFVGCIAGLWLGWKLTLWIEE